MMRRDLLSWQWQLYPNNHRARRTLVIHLFTVPVFMAGMVAVLWAPWSSGWQALGGGVAMLLSVALQGSAHKQESVAPVPFDGPVDALSRLFVEQWLTFPRFVLTGGFARAWRDARSR